MLKKDKVSKSLSKSSNIFYPNKEKEILKVDKELIENDEKRKEAIKNNLKKIISLKKENNFKAKEILVT